METDDSGQLWLRDKLRISNTVSIGVLETGKEKNQIFNSNNNFIVYDDGSVKATQGNFSGSTIGGFTIEDNRLFSNDVVLSSRGIEIRNNGILSILDGNTEVFSANKAFYEKTTDITPQEGKTYYTYNKDTDVYTVWEKENRQNSQAI